MNEMELVRDLLDEPRSPSARARGDALRALENEIAGSASRRRFAFGRLRLGLTGLVAAGAAATVAVATLGGGGTMAPEPGAQDVPARTILLAAADKAAKEPAGRFWRVQTIDGQAYRIGEGADGYTVLGHSSHVDGWWARSTSDTDVLYSRDLGARPLTPDDEEAWKKAGSPETMRARSDGRWTTLSTVPGKSSATGSGDWEAARTTPKEKRELARRREAACATDMALSEKRCQSVKEAARRNTLVDDPAKVKELLFRKGAERTSAWELMSGFDFLLRPATPQVRAAAFRALADVSGVRSLGTVTDGKGRTGIALAARGTMRGDGGTVYDYQLVLDPETHRILAGRRVVVKPGGSMAGMRPGDVLSRKLVLQAAWTNESPKPPARP